MLRTVDYGTIRIVENIDPRFDTLIRFDCVGEWAFYRMPDGEIVALELEESDEEE